MYFNMYAIACQYIKCMPFHYANNAFIYFSIFYSFNVRNLLGLKGYRNLTH